MHDQEQQPSSEATPDTEAEAMVSSGGEQETESLADAGEDVMKILAGVEDQFDQLRNLEELQSQEMASLAERSAALDQRQRELDVGFQDLQRQRDQLEQSSRHETDDANSDAELRRLERELSESRQQLQLATLKLAEFSQRLSAVPNLAAGANDGAEQQEEIERLSRSLSDAEGRIRELTEALEAASTAPSASNGDVAEAQVQLEQLRSELRALEAHAAAGETQLQKQRERLDDQQERIRSMEAEREQLAQRIQDLQTESVGTDGAHAVTAESERLEQHAKELQEHEEKLRQWQQQLKEQAQKVKASKQEAIRSADDLQLLRRQQAQVEEARKHLRQVERKMIRRWARPCAALTLAALAITLALTAVGSWLAADHFFPATMTTSVNLEAKPMGSTPPTAEALAAWQHWHEGLLFNEDFQMSLADRMAERLIEPFRSAKAVGQLLTDQVVIDDARAGVLTLSLASQDAEQAQTILDVIATTVESASNRQLEQGKQEMPGIELTGRKEDGILRFSWINPIPIEDERLFHASLTFGGAVAVILVLFALISSRLGRSKGFLEDDEDDPYLGRSSNVDERPSLRPLTA